MAGRPRAIDRIQQALAASGETKQVEFKETFDPHFDALTVRSHAKAGKLVATLEVGAATIPLIPIRLGTYEKVSGKQATAFSVGVLRETWRQK